MNVNKACNVLRECASTQIQKKSQSNLALLQEVAMDSFCSSKKQTLLKDTTSPMAILKKYAGYLSKEYEAFKFKSEAGIEKLIGFAKNGTYFGDNSQYQDTYQAITTRTKGEKSIFCKLKSKYDSGELSLSGNLEKDLNNTRKIIGDAYGSRLQLKSLDRSMFLDVLKKYNLNEQEAIQEFSCYMKNPKMQLDEKYLKVLDELKEKQTADIFERLLSAIKNNEIEIDEISNYGDDISSYFSTRQVCALVDAYSKANEGKFLKTTTKAALDVKEKLIGANEEFIGGEEFFSKKIEKTDAIKELKAKKHNIDYGENIASEAIKSKGAIKDSGYCSFHINHIQDFSDEFLDIKGNNEFQIRGTKVNAFGDVEHIPYDIRQEKITKNNLQYREIYDVIDKMTDEEYEKYNQYLTQVYDYLRLQELGIDVGSMPVLNLGSHIQSELIDYNGLFRFAHK